MRKELMAGRGGGVVAHPERKRAVKKIVIAKSASDEAISKRDCFPFAPLRVAMTTGSSIKLYTINAWRRPESNRRPEEAKIAPLRA